MKNAIQKTVGPPVNFGHVLPDPERRQQERHITMLRLAKIKTESGEGWGFIKNLSATGMMVEVQMNFDLGDTVSAMLTEDKELTGTVRWREDSFAGIEFAEPVDVAELLSKPSLAKQGRVPRLPRVEMKHPPIFAIFRLPASVWKPILSSRSEKNCGCWCQICWTLMARCGGKWAIAWESFSPRGFGSMT